MCVKLGKRTIFKHIQILVEYGKMHETLGIHGAMAFASLHKIMPISLSPET
jgi:hypothetical protein